jgi:hypothetical protein
MSGAFYIPAGTPEVSRVTAGDRQSGRDQP